MNRQDEPAQLESADEAAELQDLEEQARPFRALYEHWERNQWSATAIDFSTDAASFAALDEEAQAGLIWIFAHRFHAEFSVATLLAPFLMRAPDYEAQLVLATQIADEFRHLQCVLRVYDKVFGIKGGIEAARARADQHMDPVASALHGELQAMVSPLVTSGDEDVFLKAVCTYHLIAEGVVARAAQNLAAGQYERFGAFPGLTEGQRLVARDEARHIGFGVSFVRRRLARDREHALAVVGEVIDRFSDVAENLLEVAVSGGMESQVLAGYGVEPEGFYREAMRLFQIRLRSIGFLGDGD